MKPASPSYLQAVADGDIPADDGAADEAALAELAALPALEYDRCRKDEADRLGIRVDTLDREVAARRPSSDAAVGGGGAAMALAEPEPWPEPVAGAAMLDRIAATIRAHVIMKASAADATALWVVHAHAHSAASISPILAITSPTPECGKTTLLDVVQRLVPRALPASNITAAALFRAVEKWSPTLLVDEADTFLKDSDELRGVINSGHARSSAWVIRTAGDDHEPRRFMTWAPKAIGLIGKLSPTLASRSIAIELRRLGAGESVEPMRGDRLLHLGIIARLVARWSQDHIDALKDADPDMPKILRGRAADNWRAMLAIADAAGGDWPRRARAAAEALSGSRGEQTAGVMLLEDLQALFVDRRTDRLPSAEIVETLSRREDRPWPEWHSGKPITTRQLARLLEPFGVKPINIKMPSGNVPKGYRLDALADAFARYLPENPATPLQSQKSGGLREVLSATGFSEVADSLGGKAAENRESSAIAEFPTREPGEEG